MSQTLTDPTGDHTAPDEDPVLVIGAGPAGLTAAYELVGRGATVRVIESDTALGGISRTVQRDGWRFDIGGHRFFTKVDRVERFWHEILPGEDFLRRPRMSRIHYRGKLFDYPLRAANALRGLGLLETVRCVSSYTSARIRPPRDQSNFAGWVTARFGKRLYSIFFKTYTEKVWGVPAEQIQADWAAQRIKNLSLFRAVVNSLLPHHNQTDVTSLIEEFQYPKLGPGMMWERCADLIEKRGGVIETATQVVRVDRGPGGATGVVVDDGSGLRTIPARQVISSMPLRTLVHSLCPPAPPAVEQAAADLGYRDFLTVALVVPEEFSFPDNWIYIHDQEVKVGRIQNFGSWSPYLVKQGRTCLGLEYFVNEGDAVWSLPDERLVDLAVSEVERLGLVRPGCVQAGYAVRVPKAYPVYDETYQRNVATIRDWLGEHVPNLYPVGRNGMHRYNNQDHSMLTAMLTVENILDGAGHDIWSVNVDESYHEQRTEGTGRDAPITPRPHAATPAHARRTPRQAPLAALDHQRKLRFFLRHLPRTARILELGCGEGRLGRYAVAHGWHDYTGVDLVAPSEPPPHTFIQGDINNWRRLGLRRADYDVVIAFDVLETGDFLTSIQALLRPGGLLLVTTPVPRLDWAGKLLESVGLNQRRSAPHSHLTDLHDLPDTLRPVMIRVKSGISQWGVFRLAPTPIAHSLSPATAGRTRRSFG